MKNLFRRNILNVIDGDNRIAACNGIQKERLQAWTKNGIEVWGIQIFHYAAINYTTRWDSWPMRFLNALFNGGATITLTEDGHLALNDKEEHELQAKSSEVLAIGLSTMFMCKWFDINKNTIEKIPGNKKRCDYSFYKNSKLIIYESKGRAHKNKIGSAVADAQKKKSHHPAASEKYSLIAYLPRNGEAVELLVYDPPVTPGEFENDNLYRIAKYYQRASMLAGLYILANGIHQRIIN
jgi:hypothetical protein